MAYLAPVSGNREYVHVDENDINAIKAAWLIECYCAEQLRKDTQCEGCVFRHADGSECMFRKGNNPLYWEMYEWDNGDVAFYDDEEKKRVFSFRDFYK